MAWALLACAVLLGLFGWRWLTWKARARDAARDAADATKREASALAQVRETARAATEEAQKRVDVEAELRRELAAAQEELAKSRQPGQARAGLNGLFGAQS